MAFPEEGSSEPIWKAESKGLKVDAIKSWDSILNPYDMDDEGIISIVMWQK